MKSKFLLAVLVPATALILTACGSTKETVVVTPTAGSTVVVPHGDSVKVVTPPSP